MWCVYAFTVLSLFPLAYPASTEFVQYVSSGVLQLILLPAIMVGTAILNEGAERRAKQDHEILLQELQMLRSVMRTLNLPPEGPYSEESSNGHDDEPVSP
jgi:hypothetical protein